EELLGLDVTADGYDPEGKRPSWRMRPGFPAVGQVVGNAAFYADASGRRTLLTPFGWVWRIGVTDEIAQPAVLGHEAMAGVYRAERTLVLQPETRFGSLHLVVVDERGEALSNYGAILHGLDRDLDYNNSRMVPPKSGMTWELPAGHWHLKVLLGKEVIYE